MRVLFLGPADGTSGHRLNGFRRLGHDARQLDPRALLPPFASIDRFMRRIHPGPLAEWARSCVLRAIDTESYELAFVDGGALVGLRLVRDLQARGMRVVNFNHDDPFGRRDGALFGAYRAAVPGYDLVVVVRTENIAEARALGARRVLHHFRVADEVEHAPRALPEEIRARWKSEVAFVGTWMPERGPFLARLMDLGVPLSIYGNLWERAPQWRRLRRAYRGTGPIGRDYCDAVQSARICLGLLSRANRDLHTTRSMEIPSLGSLLCAQRTPEHEALYVDREEAVFWNDADECARHCRRLLADEPRRAQIAARGRDRFLANGYRTERLLARVMEEAFA